MATAGSFMAPNRFLASGSLVMAPVEAETPASDGDDHRGNATNRSDPVHHPISNHPAPADEIWARTVTRSLTNARANHTTHAPAPAITTD